MKLKRWLRRVATIAALLLLFLGLFAGGIWWWLHPKVNRTNGVVYGQRGDKPLTLDILKPDNPKGRGVLLMVSGSWKSKAPGLFDQRIAAPLLRQGFTVFAICHISQPKVTIMETAEDVHRAVRFVRHHAVEYGIDPKRLAVTGGSSGGHLSLLLATQGGPGSAEATDPVDRESSAVQAVAVFFPVTDLLNLGKSTENLGDGGPPKSFVKGFGPQSTNLPVWKDIGRSLSPIYHIPSNLPPVLIIHGDADTLVPLDQSERFASAARLAGQEVTLLIHADGRHGWLTMPWDIRHFGAWFDQCMGK